MHDLIRKPMTVAFAAVLLFCSVVPVPTGAAMFDRARVNHAYANPVAATAAEMALLAFETACVAGGIYIAGTTLSELNINGAQLYQEFTNYYTTQNDISQSELETILAGSYVNGNVDLSALAAAGITGALPGFATVLMNSGNATSAESSIGVLSNKRTLYIGENLASFDYGETLTFSDGSHASLMFYYAGNLYAIKESVNTTSVAKIFKVRADKSMYVDAAAFSRIDNVGANGIVNASQDTSTAYPSTFGLTTLDWDWLNSNAQVTLYDGFKYPIKDYRASLNKTYGTLLAGGTLEIVDASLSESPQAVYPANVASGVTAGTFAAVTGVVPAFSPTAEQLQAGYDASILQGISDANANLGTISTGIAALDATMNGLLGVCQGIASTLSNTVVGQYCAAVTQWLGATPFGNVMGTVIDGLDDIPDAVADGAAVVAGGVAALPGALEGVIEGVLEGVFGQPLAIPGFLQDILAGVQAIPGALEGAIEGITFPEWRWPEAPEIPRVDGEPVTFAISSDLIGDVKEDLRDKVPFCYLIRMGESFGQLFGNLQTTRSFYFDLDIPNAGSVHFDGESFLNQPFFGSNVADVIRICATALLCTGLLYESYRVAKEL